MQRPRRGDPAFVGLIVRSRGDPASPRGLRSCTSPSSELRSSGADLHRVEQRTERASGDLGSRPAQGGEAGEDSLGLVGMPELKGRGSRDPLPDERLRHRDEAVEGGSASLDPFYRDHPRRLVSLRIEAEATEDAVLDVCPT